MHPYLRIFDDVFYLQKKSVAMFFLRKFSFNESQHFLKIFREDVLMRPAVAFIFGPGKMRAIAPVKLCIRCLGPLRHGSDDCRISSATIKSLFESESGA